MSGIKDYEYSFTEARRLRLQGALQQWLQRRAAVTEARLAESRRRAQERATKTAALRTSQASATQAALAERARETQRSLDALQKAAASPSLDRRASDPESQQPAASNACDAKKELANAATVTNRIAEIEAWQEALENDEAVQAFQAPEARLWRQHADELLAEFTAGSAQQGILVRADRIRQEAKCIHDEAGQRQGKFEARNQLLRDIIDSLKEIGFFVSDPAYQDPNDPAGPVTLRATRGGEEMTASIDLSETVRSIWHGLEEQHCKSAFWEYMEQMKERGVEITAKRSELRERPILRQKGALDLPQSRTQNTGG